MAGRARRDSTARARELGGELKGAREQVRLKAAELAEILGWSPTKLSRVESGSRGVSEVDAARYLASCRVPRGEVNRLLDLARETDDGYRLRPHGRRLPDELRSLVFQETTAKEITLYEPQLIPGLLQTEEYARAVFRWTGLIAEEGVEVRVQARRARQELLRRPRPPRFAFFVHEEALRSMVGEPRVMNEQLLHLVFASDRQQCVVRVVPSAAGPCGAFGGSFRLMQYAEHPPVVYCDTQAAGVFFEDPEDVALYRRILARLADVALSGGQSREWLVHRASEYDRAEDGPR